MADWGLLEDITDSRGWRWAATSGSIRGIQGSPRLSIASQSKDEAPGIGLLLLYGRVFHEQCHLFQQLWEDGERLLRRILGQEQSLPLVAGSGGLGYGDGPGDFQLGSSMLKEGEAGVLLPLSSREATEATGCAALVLA